MDRYIIDTSGISKMFELTKNGRMRKIARLWYVNEMAIKDIAYSMGYGESVIITEIMLINKLIENNISCKTCSQCGETFYTGEKGKQICPKCKEKNRIQREEQQKETYKSVKSKSKAVKRKPFKSLKTIEKERAKYNKENGTYLSYGQYVALTGD